MTTSVAAIALVLAATLAVLAVPSAPARAADVPAITPYEGADRQQRLLEGARREGELVLYTSLTVEDMAVLDGAFEKKYGVKVRMWRAAADKVVQRASTEAQGGRHDVDVVELAAPSLESLHREQLLAPVRPPLQADLLPAAVPAHREWVGSRLNVFVQAYNTRLVSEAQLPKAYADRLDPKWRGRLGIEAGDDGQRILAQRDFVPASRRVDTPLNRMPLRIVDPAPVLDESGKWTRLYDEIIVRQAR